MKVTISGKEYDLSLTVNAQCYLEDEKKIDFTQILTELGNTKKKRKASDLRLIFHAMMMENIEGITLLKSGKMLYELSLLKFIDILPEIVEEAFPDPKFQKAGK